jgi:hypothetical protein
VEWDPIGQGEYKWQSNRADWTVRVLESGRLVFSTGIEKLEEAYEELEFFPHPKHHDDIVSALNLMCKKFMTETDLLLGESEMPSTLWDRQQVGYGMPAQGRDSQYRGLEDLISTELPE